MASEYLSVAGLTEQADRSVSEYLLPCAVLRIRGDEDDRELAPLCIQRLLQLDAAHARHLDVGNEAPCPLQFGRIEERFSRRKDPRMIPKRPHQRTEGYAYGLVVINDRNDRGLEHSG